MNLYYVVHWTICCLGLVIAKPPFLDNSRGRGAKKVDAFKGNDNIFQGESMEWSLTKEINKPPLINRNYIKGGFHGTYQDYMRNYTATFRSIPSSWHRKTFLD